MRISSRAVSAGQRVRLPKRTARREMRLPRAGNPGARDLPLVAPGDLGGGAVRVLRLRAEPPSARGGLGRPEADARPRRDHRRLGALGQRLVPAHRRARLRLGEGRRGRLLPALPGGASRCSGACSSATTCSPGSSSRSRPRFVSFLLLYRIAEERLGADGARRAVLYLAVFPFALFLQAVYSESLYLLLTLAAFMLAERRRFLAAGAVTGLALLTRPTARRAAPGARAARLARARPRPGARVARGRAAALRRLPALPLDRPRATPGQFLHAQRLWNRHLSPAGPLGGIWDGLRAGWAGIEQLASGSHTHVLLDARCRTPTRSAWPC